ncbi:MAG: hypothetical protein QNJ94_17215 [Alphaproteobacteria bacterium]|nr:hypothetical protein [Alphaproteobacteria bacterium]
MKPIRTGLIAALALSGALALTLPAVADNAPQGPVVLTVTGAVAQPNRPAFRPFHDAFLNYHNYSFEAAFAFDRRMLADLPAVSVRARAEGWPDGITAAGPRLRDVLDAAGVAPEAGVTLMALDGFALELNSEDRAAQDWVLALEVDGRSLGIGDRGPAWLLYDTGDEAVSHDAEARWIWSVFLIEAR